MSITGRFFGKTKDGKDVQLFTLTNSRGMKVESTNFGGIIVSISVPDKNGKLDDVTLGYDKLEGYLNQDKYFGALIGRHANRIEDAIFELNGRVYQLAKNDGDNHLHGGNVGFNKVVWTPEILNTDQGEYLQLTYRSRDGEENYPGNLDVKVIYSLSEDNALGIDYYAETDQDTVVNLTNHAYFNLSGHKAGDISNHQIMINADRFTVIDDEGIPTGEIRSVEGTPMDFRQLTPIGPGFDSGYEQIACGKGYDHNWVLNVSGVKPEMAAELYDPASGRVMEVYTTKPGIQFYSGNFLDGSEVCKGGAVYGKRSGLCLETQYFPNALKHKHFPSPILKAGEQYHFTTIYKFSVR
jgi:aldose 1-epimerase